MVLTPVTPVTGRPIRVAIVGAGSMGMNHVRVVRDFAEDAVELVGVAEPHAPTLARAVSRFHVTGSPDYRQLLDQTRPDVVAVVVPTHLHSEVAALGYVPFAPEAHAHAIEAIVVQAAHSAYQALDFAQFPACRVVLDGRRAIAPERVEHLGMRYLHIGGGQIAAREL